MRPRLNKTTDILTPSTRHISTDMFILSTATVGYSGGLTLWDILYLHSWIYVLRDNDETVWIRLLRWDLCTWNSGHRIVMKSNMYKDHGQKTKIGKHSSSGNEDMKRKEGSLLKGTDIRTLKSSRKRKEMDNKDGSVTPAACVSTCLKGHIKLLVYD
ncbi:hypothetical protein Tco_0007697 [Tanacetum coccineum]